MCLPVERIPAWLGGGFLFRTHNVLFRSDAFDGPLTPIVSVPSGVTSRVVMSAPEPGGNGTMTRTAFAG